MEDFSSYIDRELRRIAARLWLGRALSLVVSALLATGIVLAAVGAGIRFVHEAWLPWFAVAGGAAILAATVAAVIVSAKRRPIAFDAAAEADLNLGLKERLSSWIYLRQQGRGRLFGELLTADAAANASGAEFASVAPVRLPARARWLVFPAAVLAAVFLIRPKAPEERLFMTTGKDGEAGGAGAMVMEAPPDIDLAKRSQEATPIRQEHPAADKNRPDDKARPAERKMKDFLTARDHERILERLRQAALASARSKAGKAGGASEQTGQELGFIKTSGAAAGRPPDAGAEGEAMWRWEYPAYSREIARYFLPG